MKPFKIGMVSEFDDGRIKTYKFFAKNIAVWRRGNEFFAIENSCLHMRAQLLSSGNFVSEKVTCPWHGWLYDMGTGACLTQSDLFLKRYAVSIDNNEVILDISTVLDS